MSEEQKKQTEAIMTEVNRLAPQQREAALAYMQGMTAAAKLMEKNRRRVKCRGRKKTSRCA